MNPERTSRYKGVGGSRGALLHNLLALINLTSLGLGLSQPHCRRYGGSGNCGVQLAHSHGASVNSIHYNLH